MKTIMQRLVFWVILLVCIVTGPSSLLEGRVLSPEEVSLFLQNVIEKTTPDDYWGIWRVRNYQKNRDTFYEVAYLKDAGFGWKNLSDERRVIVGTDRYRFIYDLDQQEVVTVLPGFEIPFLPALEDSIDLFQENYLLDFSDTQILILSRETGEPVRSFSLDYRGALSAQTYFDSDGQAVKEGRFLYRDYSPGFEQIAFAVEAIEKCLDQILEITEETPREGRMLSPQILPPGYRLVRVFMVKGNDGDVFQSLFSDGINSFSIFQSVYPQVSSRSRPMRTVTIRKEGNLSVLVGETRGFLVTLIGNLELEAVNEIFLSLSFEGGW